MAIQEGDKVTDPRRAGPSRMGTVMQVRRNPACLMRTLVVRWYDDKSIEELEEMEFGPLED